ncbi:MAG: class I SAM-dependent methyltransferase [Anaerolineales bacterium]
MDIPLLSRLTAAEGRDALRLALGIGPREEKYLADLAALERQGVERELARGALETVLLRIRAEKKFSRAGEMFFTREGLEQSSAEAVSRRRAARFRGFAGIADLGCGIGGDTIALAGCAPVWALDREELRLRMARENVSAYAPAHPVRFILTDLLRPGMLFAGRKAAAPPMRIALYCDPSRREEDRRVFSVRRYSPPLGNVTAWRAAVAEEALCVKISPGVRWEEIEREPCEVEFVSWRGELKEAVLWYGAFQSARRRATILPEGETMTDAEPASDAVSPPRRILYEPDPSILRAGLVRPLAARLGAARIDPEIAYLTADEPVPTAWAQAYRIEEAMPFGLKRLREWLRAHSVGRVVIKKRGSPLEPEDLEKQLRLKGEESRILFLTQVAGKHTVLIAQAQKA